MNIFLDFVSLIEPWLPLIEQVSFYVMIGSIIAAVIGTALLFEFWY